MKDAAAILALILVSPFLLLVAVVAIVLWTTRQINLPPASAPRGSQLRVSTRLVFLLWCAAALAGTAASAPAVVGGAPTPSSYTQHNAMTAPLASPIMTAAPVAWGMLANVAGQPDGDFILKLVASVSFLVNFFLLLGKLKGGAEKREITNDPLEVREKKVAASQKELTAHVQENHEEHRRLEALMKDELRRIYDKLDSTRDTLMHAGDERERALSTSIDKMRGMVGELRGQVAEIAKRVK